MPLGLTREAEDLLRGSLIHEPLAIGVATMIFLALRSEPAFA
jgi:hypothetical protein